MTAKLAAALLAAALAAPALAQDAPPAAAPPAATPPAAAAPPAAAPAGPVTLTAVLNGDNELDNGDPDGKGAARITIDGAKLCYDVDYHRLAPVTMAHIHAAPAGKNGDPVVVLKLDPDDFIKGCLAVAPALAAAIVASPKDYYVNVHTSELPQGAIRGQFGS